MKMVMILIGLACVGCCFCVQAVTVEDLYRYTADAYGTHTPYGISVATKAALVNR